MPTPRFVTDSVVVYVILVVSLSHGEGRGAKTGTQLGSRRRFLLGGPRLLGELHSSILRFGGLPSVTVSVAVSTGAT
ncbi:uncharacterized protein F4822DRAFT_421343 [Hypoxylon trugodes]|uniref:uncharacterized protein n=1 Tax=Hypoxylon trugodes TaxID=326681 RepID=UPI00219DC025|nr:uncharacterized protein F4822DRAFT_421343 [Hypoxylon trugodes]KAI1383667.1 hypothetical protein F4822DRAFT_421343 [Hypoxylon trugodes]